MTVLNITQVLPNNIFCATGIVECKDAKGTDHKLEADVLLKQTEIGKVKLFLDSRIKISKIAGKEVTSYTMPVAEEVSEIKEGSKVEIKKEMWFVLKH